jgi:hypothetical protein
MRKTPDFRPWIAVLLAGAVLLPIAICVVFGVGTLLSAMGDASGGAVLNRIGLAVAILWVFGLIVLMLFLSLNSLFSNQKDDPPDES